eukprot:2848413-Rhodomonas_salina.1
MVGDSGANRHFIPTERRKDFMFRVEEVEQEIGGMCLSSQASTTHFGIFAGTAMGAKKKDYPQVPLPITSVAFAVKNGKKALFSEVQACFAGNTVLHKGHPKTGMHWIFMQDPKDPKNQYFVPYEWSDKDHCWYLRLSSPTDPLHCLAAKQQCPGEKLKN